MVMGWRWTKKFLSGAQSGPGVIFGNLNFSLILGLNDIILPNSIVMPCGINNMTATQLVLRDFQGTVVITEAS